MPDLNEQLTLVKRGPYPFAPSTSVIPVRIQLAVGVDRFWYGASWLLFYPFGQGATSLTVVAGGIPTTRPPTINAVYVPYAVRGQFPSGTRIRFGSGMSAFIVRLTAPWAPQAQLGGVQPPTVMSVDPTPGANDTNVQIEVSANVDYLPRGLRTVSTDTVWGALRDYSVGEDVDQVGSQIAVSNAGYLLRYDEDVAKDQNIVNATLTDSLGRAWQVVGVELEPGARRQYMTLRVKR